MKRILSVLLMALCFCAVGFAQKNKTVITSREFSDTQARLLEVTAKSYVKPLVAEFQVRDGGKFERYVRDYPKALVEIGMDGSLDNLRSRVIFDVTDSIGCDAIVAATFKIDLIETKTGDKYRVVMKGVPADFVIGSWHPMAKEDYEWIRIDNNNYEPYHEGAVIKNIKK
ncbi:MAG: hypothetical protein IKZ92_04150 [Muribaculaceae bacterium]|nr:hypothetical protein [Muribaculaceae bacterium]